MSLLLMRLLWSTCIKRSWRKKEWLSTFQISYPRIPNVIKVISTMCGILCIQNKWKRLFNMQISSAIQYRMKQQRKTQSPSLTAGKRSWTHSHLSASRRAAWQPCSDRSLWSRSRESQRFNTKSISPWRDQDWKTIYT